ncbi:MAG TPA: PEP/pyruvate-binding domain-containing protein [Solidesulfovibrio sp.]|nr:PEP/pyruvate-binding domain-containing protein [Solidesulfovibrio sp.]
MSTVLAGLRSLLSGLRRNRPKLDREATAAIFRNKYNEFQSLLESNTELLKIFSEMEVMLEGREVFGMAFIRSRTSRAIFHAIRMIKSFERLSGRPQPALLALVERLSSEIKTVIGGRVNPHRGKAVLMLSEVTADIVDQVGGKCANLGEVANRVGLPVPGGFCVTTAAFRDFFAEAGLFETIASIRLGITPDDPASMAAAAEDIQAAILRAALPETLARDLDAAARASAGSDGDAARFAVRSSAIGEDGELSFAGQYLTMLNVAPDRIASAYKFVIASLYTPRAMSYRLLKGIPDDDVAMAAACLRLVPSRAAGVLYTRLPENPGCNELLINAVWGLGPYAVDGVITPDAVRLDRDSLAVTFRDTPDKPRMLVPNESGGLTDVAVPDELRREPCLDDDAAKRLGAWGMFLERHFGRPQDMEWALNENGDLCVLQSRQLTALSERGGLAAGPPVPGAEIVAEGGQSACAGAGAGPVHLVRDDADLDGFPQGAVLVAQHSSPQFMVAMQRAAAIVTDQGSVTGHMASLSREFGVPTLLGLEHATRTLAQGEVVTVDAAGCRIYRGRVESLLTRTEEGEPFMAGTQVHAILDEAARRVVPLTLLDPKSPQFRADNCTSLHDVTRLLHEWSYGEMFAVSDLASGQQGVTATLDATTGLDLHIIDLGGGIREEAGHKRRVTPGDIASRPFRALLQGLVLTGDALALKPVNLGGFLSVMSEQMLAQPKAGGDRFGDKSYAIISDKYLNFSSRVGYHYGVLDCYCGATVNKNYITFSFAGGAADDVKRSRRARAIGRILEALDFTVDAAADRVAGRFQKVPAPLIEEKLAHMGRLLQFTRQTDMLMVSEASIDAMVACFLSGAPCFDPAHAGQA